MRRLFVAGMVLLLIAEAVAALGFIIGFFWLGRGVVPGIMIAIGLVVLVLLPWLGDLVVEFDSLPKEATVKLAWWARAQVFLGDEKLLKLRVFGLPFRRSLKPKERKPEKPEEPQPDMKRWARENAANLSRMALAALQAGNELFWQSKAFSLTVNAPAQTDIVDQIVAGVVGYRKARMLDLRVLPEGPRRIRFIYRIGLLDIASAGLFVLVQGRALALARSMGRARKQAKATQESRPGRPPRGRP